MSKLKIVIIDIESGHTLETLEREWKDMTAADAADDVRSTLDCFGECEEISDD